MSARDPRDPEELARAANQRLAAGRDQPIPDEAKRRLRERLAAETGGALSARAGARVRPGNDVARGHANAPGPWRRGLLALSLVGVGAALGVAGDRLLPRPARPQVLVLEARREPPPDSPALAIPRSPAEPPPAPPSAPVATTDPLDAGSHPPARHAQHGGRDTDLAAERALLEIARTALGRRDGRGTIDALSRHAREFPRGRLEEERESLWVQALVQTGRIAEARDRGARFRRRFPDSLLLPAIDAALARAPR